MRAAVETVDRRARRRRRARQQRRLQPVGRDRGGPDRRRAPAVRDERLRARAHVPARPPGHARAARGADRQRLLDGRELHVPGRRPLPRDEVRGRGHQRRAALRGRGLRGRRRRSSSPGSSAPASPTPPSTAIQAATPRPTARTRRSTRRSPARRRASTSAGRSRASAAAPETVARTIERAITAQVAEDPLPRHAVGAPAHRPARADDRRHVGPLPRHPVPAPGRWLSGSSDASPAQCAAPSPGAVAPEREPYGGAQNTSTCRSSSTEWKRCSTRAPT